MSEPQDSPSIRVGADAISSARARRAQVGPGGAQEWTDPPAITVTADEARAAEEELGRRGWFRERHGSLPLTLTPDAVRAAHDRMAVTRQTLANAPETEATGVCPWCGDAIRPVGDPNGPAYACPNDGTVQHRRHWDEGGGCAIVGCSLQPTV